MIKQSRKSHDGQPLEKEAILKAPLLFSAREISVPKETARIRVVEESNDKTIALNKFNDSTVSQFIDKLGFLLVGMKKIFDNYCVKGETRVNINDAIPLLLEFGLRGNQLAAACSSLGGPESLVDFQTLLLAYAECTGLTVESSNIYGLNKTRFWVPNIRKRKFIWTELDKDSILNCAKATRPFSHFLSVEVDSDSESATQDFSCICISNEDIVHVIMIAMKQDTCTASLVTKSIKEVTAYLPNLPTGIISFHELLVVYAACCENASSF